MKMDRREFFKVLAASLTVAAVPAIAAPIKDWVPFKDWSALFQGKEFGAAVALSWKWEDYAEWTAEFLVDHARKTLGKGVTVEIRVAVPHDYGRRRAAAWYTNTQIAGKDPTGLHPLKMNNLAGFWEAGRLRT